jgi:hypothetical protein
MVQVSNQAGLPKPAFEFRRHSDPPQLWLGVLIGSIGLHGWLLAITVPLMMQASSSQSQSASVPIEMVELLPSDAAVSNPTETAADTASANETGASAANSQPSTVRPNDPAPPAPAELTPSTPAADPQPDQFRLPDTAPELQPSASPPDTRSAPLPQLSPDVPIEPPLTPVPSDEQLPLPSPNVGNLPSESEEPLETDELPNPPVSDNGANSDIAGVPPNSPNLGGSGAESLPDVAVAEQARPSSFSASLRRVDELQPDGGARDRHAVPPEPITATVTYDPTAIEFGDCSLSAGSVSDFGETVYLQVTVEVDGSVSNTQVHSNTDPRVSEAYLELAQCLMKTWQFTPAQDAVVDAATGTQRLIPVPDDTSIVAIEITRQN